MNEILANSAYFGFFLSLLTYMIGLKIQQKTKWSVCNPLLISVVLLIVILKVIKVDYDTFNEGTQYITYLLTPATVCLALPLYRQLKILKEHLLPLMLGLLAGCITCMVMIVGFVYLLHLDSVLGLSLLPKSITTAIAIGVSAELGGIEGITVASVVITGIFSAVVATGVFRLFHIKNPIAQGVALGAAGHAIGTSKALQLGEVQGAMGSLAIVVTGIMTVIVAPFVGNWFL